jgi:hypothetical protein
VSDHPPVIFLDIDGVLNHHETYRLCAQRPGQTAPADWLDPACVARVNALCERTGAVLVISSSWREYLDGWRGVAAVLAARGLTAAVLAARGLTAAVIDQTPDRATREGLLWTTGTRWDEIDYWLTWHPDVTRWVVLDDCEVGAACPREHFVRTDIAVGLTDADVERAAVALALDADAPPATPDGLLHDRVHVERGRLIAAIPVRRP